MIERKREWVRERVQRGEEREKESKRCKKGEPAIPPPPGSGLASPHCSYLTLSSPDP